MPDTPKIPVPDLNRIDVVCGNIGHLPAWDDIPEEFRKRWHQGNAYCDFISQWFYSGLGPEDLARLTPREGVDRTKALAAVKAIIGSFEPQHEHKTAGAGYLLSEWFELAPAAKSSAA